MTDDIRRTLNRLIALHDNIAVDLGQLTLRCEVCGEESRPTTADVAKYLRNGWPKHCGETMKAETE